MPSSGPLARAGSLCGIGGFWLPPYPKRRRYECVVHGTGIPCLCPRCITCYIRLDHGAILAHLYGCVNTFSEKIHELFLNSASTSRPKFQNRAIVPFPPAKNVPLSRFFIKNSQFRGRFLKTFAKWFAIIYFAILRNASGPESPFKLREGCVQ